MYLIKYSKSPYYQIIYFVNGKRTKKSTKKTEEAAAKDFLREFAASLKQKPVEVKTSSILLSKFKEEYIKYSEQSKSKHYLKSIGLSFRQLTSYTGDISLLEISTRTLDQFITSVYSRSKSAAGLYHRTLKAAFSKAEAWEYIPSNPFKKIKSPKQVKSLPIFITKDELRKILDCT
ncbi:MAG: phage integrase SAM-like domain-containing protein, partial [Ignavibacteriaceae bacterium]|nr:phage integrase SAM-like domain-containing protein [Ignavibacteriaceae bacterium]